MQRGQSAIEDTLQRYPPDRPYELMFVFQVTILVRS